jgi:hypothetical protein
MKGLLALVVLGLTQQAAHGQFYAPAVDFHDVAQRRFPVEAARVLAWIKNGEKPLVSEVVYKVSLDPARQVVWLIEWRGKGTAVVRKATLRYPEEALLTGADWYRLVWRQLAGANWAMAKGEPADLTASFWSGAQKAGMARMEGISAGLALTATPGKLATAQAAQMAGTLTQAALPMIERNYMLDGALLARAAAWLCVAEQQNGQAAGAEWGPLLTLAGREKEARLAWGKSTKLAAPAEALWLCWDDLIRMPPVQEALGAISTKENRLYALPVYLAYGWAEQGYHHLLESLCTRLYPKEAMARMYDYGAALSHPLMGPEPLLPEAPVLVLKSCLDAFRQLPAAPGDALEARNVAEKIHDFDQAPSAMAPPSPELLRFVQLGVEEDKGPLIPVAVATARDILIHAHDAGGVEFTAVMQSYGRGTTGQSSMIDRQWFKPIPSWNLFMGERNGVVNPPPMPDLARYQYTVARALAARLIRQPPAEWGKAPDALLRRRWLVSSHRGLEYLILRGGQAPQAQVLLKRLIREGGQRELGPLLWEDNLHPDELRSDAQSHYKEVLEAMHLRDEIVEAVPLSTVGPLLALEEKYRDGKNPFAFAQGMERICWQSGLGESPDRVFHQYVRANALASAARFHDRWADSLPVYYYYTTTLGAANYALAVLQKDAPRQEAALKKLKTNDRTLEIIAALQKDDVEQARQEIDRYIKSHPGWTRVPDYEHLREFLDLLPALRDAKSADHARALDAFPKTPDFLFLQWTLLAKARLSPVEAERFFDDGDPAGERRLVMLAYRGDKAAFTPLYEKLLAQRSVHTAWTPVGEIDYREGNPRTILLAWLRNALFAVPPPKEEPDLMPPGGEPLLPALRKIVGGRR